MTAIKKLNCHSPFKHYIMFHDERESGYGNSVFNVENNFYCNSMSTGNIFGRLFGAIGIGAGIGIAENLLNTSNKGQSGNGLWNSGMWGGSLWNGGIWGCNSFPMFGMFG